MRGNIQYLGCFEDPRFAGNGITLSKIGEPRAFDEFDINVIDLSSAGLWICDDRTKGNLNIDRELKDLNRIIRSSSNSNILIVLPQNIEYSYIVKREKYSVQLKTLIGVHLENWISELAEIPSPILVYENTMTTIKGVNYKSSFHFSDLEYGEPIQFLTKSIKSNKNTTMMYNGIYFTTMEVLSYDALVNLLDYIIPIEAGKDAPEWISEISLFDDEKQKSIIISAEESICKNNELIHEAKTKMEENSKYKSILYTNGDELIRVVFEMLEKMLNYDLSTFKDDKKEDFLICLDEITFIGEIKGVTSNIKNEHLSQLDVHFQGYVDMLEEKEREDAVKAILIINHQRSKKLSDREPVHEKQIKLAGRNGSLIIETSILLKLFEQFINNEISSQEIIELFTKSQGLLLT